ncbi:AraC family transcriptional regulator [Gemmobacter nanjingensis]|uniref:AraC family transcriptional regulator n=1 Tax=Gemmobacter nanjingensis TaxID=488454 RepID=A0ABQ3FE32_9RHOB|nr:helix-turn-helix domain-containing protein [Gemmobacter nanjingensis]GHC20178.1 AraC family transcriptional regulator [Gemmobacter nanjingensis]
MDIIAHSTALTAPAQRAVHWNRVIAETYFPLHLTYRDARSFTGTLERREMGQVSLSRLCTEPLQYERLPDHISHTREEEYLVTIPRRSPVEFHQLGRQVRCDPGGFILERGDEPYRFSYGAANELTVLKISKRMLAEKLRDPDRFCARIIDAGSGLPALFSAMMGQLQVLPETEARAAAILGRQTVEVLALALEGNTEDGEAGVRTAVRAGHLRRAEHVIRQNLSNTALSPEYVADACGISKRYLHELFSDTNKTVSQFIREERLIAARDVIGASRHLPMAEIAYRFGFSDQAQFSRLFKALFGLTPTDWRRQAGDA